MNPIINPLARNGKFGWYNTFRKHVTLSTSCTNARLVLTGDSIIANFDKYNGTSLKQTLREQKLLSPLERCLPWRGLN